MSNNGSRGWGESWVRKGEHTSFTFAAEGVARADTAVRGPCSAIAAGITIGLVAAVRKDHRGRGKRKREVKEGVHVARVYEELWGC